MIDSRSYRTAFFIAIALHVSLMVMLFWESGHEHPVLVREAVNQPGRAQPLSVEPPIQAVSVNRQEVMKAVNQLKQEKAHERQVELNRQRALQQQAEKALQQRLAEQQRLKNLKQEAEKIAIAHQKKLLEEKEHLKQVMKAQEEQAKKLAQMKEQEVQLKKQQVLEAAKAAELAKKKAADQAKAEQLLAEKAKADLLKKQQVAAAQQAAQDAANNARVAGEVDKYKALIINAISQQWILPDNANSNLSSQFRIRLAPNGAVLDVTLTRSSGDPILDRSAQSAIYKASPLPVPQDPTAFNVFRDISLTVRPVNARG